MPRSAVLLKEVTGLSRTWHRLGINFCSYRLNMNISRSLTKIQIVGIIHKQDNTAPHVSNGGRSVNLFILGSPVSTQSLGFSWHKVRMGKNSKLTEPSFGSSLRTLVLMRTFLWNSPHSVLIGAPSPHCTLSSWPGKTLKKVLRFL